MLIPKKFLINGHVWRVKRAKALELDGEPCDGKCEPEIRQISLVLNLKDEKQVFLHELLHAILYEYGFGLTSIHCDVEELLVECISQKLDELFILRFKSL